MQNSNQRRSVFSMLLFLLLPLALQAAEVPDAIETTQAKRGKADSASLRVEHGPFSVVVPKGWFFLNTLYSELKPSTKVNGKTTQRYTGEVTLAPEADITNADVFLAVRDSFPGLSSKKHAKVTKESWQGREWQLSEDQSKTSPDGGKTWVNRTNWLATTPYKDGQIAILAGTPSEKADQLRLVLRSVMESVVISK